MNELAKKRTKDEKCRFAVIKKLLANLIFSQSRFFGRLFVASELLRDERKQFCSLLRCFVDASKEFQEQPTFEGLALQATEERDF